jgi:hypothetical protein
MWRYHLRWRYRCGVTIWREVTIWSVTLRFDVTLPLDMTSLFNVTSRLMWLTSSIWCDVAIWCITAPLDLGDVCHNIFIFLKNNESERPSPGNPRCRGEIRRWRHGSYTLVHDTDPERAQYALDAMLYCGCEGTFRINLKKLSSFSSFLLDFWALSD